MKAPVPTFSRKQQIISIRSAGHRQDRLTTIGGTISILAGCARKVRRLPGMVPGLKSDSKRIIQTAGDLDGGNGGGTIVTGMACSTRIVPTLRKRKLSPSERRIWVGFQGRRARDSQSGRFTQLYSISYTCQIACPNTWVSLG